MCPDVPLGAQNFQSEPDVDDDEDEDEDEDELETDASSLSDSAFGSVKTKLAEAE